MRLRLPRRPYMITELNPAGVYPRASCWTLEGATKVRGKLEALSASGLSSFPFRDTSFEIMRRAR